MENLKHILSELDSSARKFSDEMEIESMIRSLRDGEISPELHAELIAFDPWYISALKYQNQSNTSDDDYTDIITDEIINYWERRIEESQNPVIIARYCKLVWRYKFSISETKPSHIIAERYIKEVLKIVDHDYLASELNLYGKLKEVLLVAITINNNILIVSVKECLIAYEKRLHDDKKAGLWGHSFDLLIADKDISKRVQLTKDEKDSIILDLTNRLQRLLESHDHVTNSNIWEIQHIVVNRLLPFYKKEQKSFFIKRLLNLMEILIDQHIKTSKKVMPSFDDLHSLAQLYRDYGLKEDVNRVLVKINEAGKFLKEEGTSFKTRIEIPKEVMDKFFQYVNKMTEHPKGEVLQNIAIQFIPNREEQKNTIEENAKKFPLLYLGKTLNFKEGRMSSIINDLEDDLDGHIIKEMIFEFLTISGFMLGEVFKKIKELKYLTKDILDFIVEDSPIINDRNKEILHKAIDSYLQDDYLIFMHLAIPQIEAIFRNLIEYNGGVILSPKNEVYQFRIMDDLLRDKLLKQSIGEDLSVYYRVLLTDSRGWNLRNDICHGIAELSDFDKVKADRIFHALLCLGLIKTVN